MTEPSARSITPPELSPEELVRFERHIILPEVGLDGQRRLKAARVLCIGAGGLGSPVALYLAAAGVGTLGLVDFDAVEASNLQRQILHGTPDVGRPKLASARDRLLALNPGLGVELHDAALTAANAMDLLARYDVIVDGSDNFATRYVVNDACVLLGKPNAYGSISRFEGQASVFAVRGGPCYRCLHPEPPPPGLVPTCAEGGVLGVLPGLIGTIQATETLKLILGIGEPLVGRFVIYDALRMRFRELALPRDPDCAVCGDRPTIRAPIDYPAHCGPTMPARAPVEGAAGVPELSALELKQRLDAREDLVLLDVREPHEVRICGIEGALHIPLGQLPARLDELDPDRPLVVYCRVGVRSARAVTDLQRAGFARAINLRGGILDWIDQVEPRQTKY